MSNFNDDELVAPDWMNEEFFEEILQKCEKNNFISITDVKIKPATVKGDHYASVIFRAIISYNTKELEGKSRSMIIKTMPELDGHKKELFAESYVFETEIAMYTNTIPKFEAELRKIGDNTVLGARLLYHSLEPRKCIIFEDIVPKGYETLRDRFLNLDEAKATFLKLAKWHAVSHKLAAEGDKEVSSYQETFLNMKGVEEMPMITSGMDNFIEKLETIDELKQYIPKLRLIQNYLIKRCIAFFNTCRQPSATGLFALCHGDFHSKNIMFKRNDRGELEDVMLLDFQQCFYGPAVLDLLYGMYMLVSEDLRRNHRDELIHYYSSNFIETLKRLEFKGPQPKIAEFYIEVMRHRHFELFLIIAFLPMWYAMAAQTMESEELLTSADAQRKVYDNPVYIDEVKRTLPLMFYRGYLD